jgi:hypothetical protein
MKKHILGLLITISAFTAPGNAQDTLPKFSLINAGNNRVIIGWVNTMPNVKQISIQRSFDSLTGYKSILTVPDPTTIQNGYMDAKAINDHMFYRLYIMLDKGNFMFSSAKKPVKDTGRIASGITINPKDEKPFANMTDSFSKVAPVVIKLNGFASTDSLSNPNSVLIKNRTNAFVPSLYVFTCRDGYVCIKLPNDEKAKKFSIKFFDEDQFLFELKDINETEFKIDKANFYHAGWFRFEIYDDGKLFEKHKFYLQKDF